MKISKSQIESIVYEIREKRRKESDAERKAFTESKEVEAAARKVYAVVSKLPKWYLSNAWSEDKEMRGIKSKYIDHNFKSKLKPLKGHDALFHHINLIASDCATIGEVMEKIKPYV